MLKKGLCILLMAVLLLGGCGVAGSSGDSSEVSSVDSGETGITVFSDTINGVKCGLSPQELLVRLDELGYELKKTDDNIFEEYDWYVDDGRQYNTANYQFAYVTKNGMTFEYNEDGTFERFVTTSLEVYTAEGLRNGDNLDRMKDIYGDGYVAHPDSGVGVLQYFNGEWYMYIGYNKNSELIHSITITKQATFIDYN